MDPIITEETITHLPQKPYPTIAQGFGIFGISILIQLAVGMVLGDLMRSQPSLGAFILYNLSLGLSILFAWKMGNRTTLELGPFPLILVPILILMTPAISLLMEPVIELIPFYEKFQELFSGMLGENTWLIFATVAISAPLLEEILFRGIILDGFLKNYSPTKAIFWSAVIFGLIHMNPYQFIAATLIGILMGWIYWRTGSLWLCILIHFINNSLGFFMNWIFELPEDSMDGTRALMNNDSQYFMMLGIAAVIVVIGLFLLDKLMAKAAPLA